MLFGQARNDDAPAVQEQLKYPIFHYKLCDFKVGYDNTSFAFENLEVYTVNNQIFKFFKLSIKLNKCVFSKFLNGNTYTNDC